MEHWEEGVRYAGPTTDPFGRVKKHELRLGRASSLSEMKDDFTFFTPAVLYVLGVIGDQPLIDFMCEMGRDVPIYYKKFSSPLFFGLNAGGDRDWNHVLWAVDAEIWDALCDFYCSVAVRVLATNRLRRVAVNEVKVIDPLAAARHGVVTSGTPKFGVHVFGVNGTDGVAAIVPGPNPLVALPGLKFFPADEATRVFADALTRGDNPHDAEDAYRKRRVERGEGK